MKFVLNSLACFMVLMLISRIVLWIAVDIPLNSKAMLVLLLLAFFFVYRNKWTYIFAYVLFISGALYPWIYNHISGFGMFDFTSSLYNYYKSTQGDLRHFIIIFPRYFYCAMILLFLFPGVWKAYRIRK